MANLPEANTWEPGIYQIEKTDPVDGGPDGLSNTQGKQLANRTAYLKREVELRAAIASPDFTGNPTAPTQAPGNSSTRLANTAFVQAAVQALVDAAPGALDTLNELAAALGDDPNFATTIMNALAGKAPLAYVIKPGFEMSYPFPTAPLNWYSLNGAILNRADAPELWAAVEASSSAVSEASWIGGWWGSYSSGDGVSTFRLPDLRGLSVRGWDAGRGLDPGRSLGTYQADLIGNHNHYIPTGAASGGVSTTTGTNNVGGGASTGFTGGDETRVKNVSRNWIVFAGAGA